MHLQETCAGLRDGACAALRASPRKRGANCARASVQAPPHRRTDTAHQLQAIDLPGPAVDLTSCANVGDTASAIRRCVVVRTPDVPMEKNEAFLDMMEAYFARPREVKMQDCRPDTSYQIGCTPSCTEVPRAVADAELQQRMAAYTPGNEASPPAAADVKWRFFWRLYAEHTARHGAASPEQVVPAGAPGWAAAMDAWGYALLDTARTVSKLLALSYGLPEDAFSSLLRNGRHLLAPTGTDLREHGHPGTVFAGYHYDLNFLTIHGKSRYPGLHVWLRDGTRAAARVPEGCLLLQAGRQLAWLTGGAIREGMHEVVCSEDTMRAMARAEAAGQESIWRVSSTVFAHLGSEVLLRPMAGNVAGGATEEFPETRAGDYVAQELRQIQLAAAAAEGACTP